MFAGFSVKEDYLGDSSDENRLTASVSPLTANLKEHYLSDESSSPSTSPVVEQVGNRTRDEITHVPSSSEITTTNESNNSFVLITANTQSPQLAPTTTLVTLSTAIDSQNQEHSYESRSSQHEMTYFVQNEDSHMVQSFLNESTKSQPTSLHPQSSVFEESDEIDTESESSLHEDQMLPSVAVVNDQPEILLTALHEKLLIERSNDESCTTTATIETSSSVVSSTILSHGGEESAQPSQQTTTIPSVDSITISSALSAEIVSPSWMDVLIMPTSPHFSLFLNTGLIACVTVIVMSINEILFHE
ncbi:hypothetical protein FDP41_001580 [Naegleria fowleri]|uniref:Uncharacterized protein n=1 Tax=Naegleria fowleri TaxID=5763 RepID=A0A6A5BQ56_NAEFO|nr:uncharacterized protein FDP41_001580 [Naegleria fowleri]KAF0979237.1 hypothetical protein FDP41_001580 [Naegleria fowleri]CAG4715637.1 unnamed protein product [Naegleria fowleri]